MMAQMTESNTSSGQATKQAPGATVTAGYAMKDDPNAGFRAAGHEKPPRPDTPSANGLGALGGLSNASFNLGMGSSVLGMMGGGDGLSAFGGGGIGGGIGAVITKLLSAVMEMMGGSGKMTFLGNNGLMKQMADITGANPHEVTKVEPNGQEATAPTVTALEQEQRLRQQQQARPAVAAAGPQMDMGSA